MGILACVIGITSQLKVQKAIIMIIYFELPFPWDGLATLIYTTTSRTIEEEKRHSDLEYLDLVSFLALFSFKSAFLTLC